MFQNYKLKNFKMPAIKKLLNNTKHKIKKQKILIAHKNRKINLKKILLKNGKKLKNLMVYQK